MNWLDEQWGVVYNSIANKYRVRNSHTGEFYAKDLNAWAGYSGKPEEYTDYAEAKIQAEKLTWWHTSDRPSGQ